MDEIIAWSGFLGAWLLVAGPMYQATLELRDEDIQRDELRARGAAVDTSPVSGWWWLIPPVMYLKRRKRSREIRIAVIKSLEQDHRMVVVDYLNKATGWLCVALGGLLIAIEQTFEVSQHQGWPLPVFLLLILVMAGTAFGFIAHRTQHSQNLLAEQDARSTGPG